MVSQNAILTILLPVLMVIAGCNGPVEQPESENKTTGQSPSVAETKKQSPSAARIKTKLRFELSTAVSFKHESGKHPEMLLPECMGGGVVLADFNRDAAVDILLVNSGKFDSDYQLVPSQHLLLVNDGRGNFSDGTDSWGLTNTAYGMGGTVGDFDNDGWPDLFLTTYDGHDQLLRNTGTRFEDVTLSAGIRHEGWSSSAAFFDMENDGDLDLYVIRYVNYVVGDTVPCFDPKGSPIHCSPKGLDPVPDLVYRNNGDGTFSDVSQEVRAPETGKGLALVTGDVDNDGDVDIYVANDTTANALLINDGNAKFEDQAGLSGTAFGNFGQQEAGMGVDFTDVTGNGLMDIVCTNFQGETTSIYMQQEEGYFLERSDQIGVGKVARRRLSFGVDFFDADNDGDEDLLVANGHIYPNAGDLQNGIEYGQQNTLYELQDGSFDEVTDFAGSGFSERLPSRGLATSDLDYDGDLDFIIVNVGERLEYGINESIEVGNFVRLWLEGTESNRSALGAQAVAEIGDRTIVREIRGGSSYLSACDQHLWFGLGEADKIDKLTIRWPGSVTQVVVNLPAGGPYHLVEGEEPNLIKPGEYVAP